MGIHMMAGHGDSREIRFPEGGVNRAGMITDLGYQDLYIVLHVPALHVKGKYVFLQQRRLLLKFLVSPFLFGIAVLPTFLIAFAASFWFAVFALSVTIIFLKTPLHRI